MAAEPTTDWELQEDGCYAGLTKDDIDITATMDRVRSPQAGAIVLFAGTTRDNFGGRPVLDLHYSAYEPRALRTMLSICRTVKRKYSLISIAMIHRLGTVAIGKESVLIAVSSPHRKAAWKAGEEALEECKRQVEVWKKELFGDMDGGVWRANRDETAGTQTGASENDNAPEVGSHGPVIRATRPGERGHGPVVHPSGP